MWHTRLRGESVQTLEWIVRAVDRVNDRIGRAVAWLTLGCVLTCFLVVVLRYGFSIGYPWMQELYVWQHAVVFLGGAGYTFWRRGHVNVDIFYGKMEPRRKAWLDIVGTLIFLFPWLAVLSYGSAPFILGAWDIREGSAQAGGMPGVFLLKTMLWVFCLLVGLQGFAFLARRILFLNGRDIDAGTPNAVSSPSHQAVDAGSV
jgi:TRAP-type mannitol/chloroaromatic compound transport system permease small subunit